MGFRILAAPLAVLAAGLLAACNDSAPTPPTTPSPQSESAATYLLSGIVYETLNGAPRPVADIRVDIYYLQSCGTNCSTQSVQVVRSDQSGRYTLEMPKARAFVFAWYPGSEPCLATAAVDKDTALDVHVVPVGPSLPLAAGPPMLTGIVYENTPQGKTPLRAADVWLEVGSGEGWPVARTRTDDAGRFRLCQFSYGEAPWEVKYPNLIMYVDSPGHQRLWQHVFPSSSSLTLDITLQR